jgi:ATP-dependent exoDNAse (exonuclease V) beta subunit
MRDRRLLYVGMTRAESFLAITASGHSPCINDISDSPACTVVRPETSSKVVRMVG